LAAGVAGVLTLAGCTVGPQYRKPDTELPTAWAPAIPGGTEVRDARWWTVYADPVLERLIDEALASNANLLLATARIDEARAVLKGTAAQEQPSAFADLDASRSRASDRVFQQQGSAGVRNDFRAAVDVSYEVDLWGRLRSATKAARADLLATEAARETVRLALISDVTQAYFAVRSFDELLAATRRSLASRSESLELQQRRLARGVLSAFEFHQREAEVAQARAEVPALERLRSQQQNALAVLLGRSPKAIYEGSLDAGRDAEGTTALIAVPSGVPSELLLRRPDLIEAEQRLIAANARINAARALYFPRISLTGYLGGESVALGSLFSGSALIWGIAAGLTQPLWAGGRIAAEVEGATAREQQAIAQYQGSIQNAFREVRDALVAQVRAREQVEAQSQRVTALNETLRLAKLRYANGFSSQLDVLDAERSLLAAEQIRIEALRAQRAAIADLFKALGGSWDAETAR
jgi:multidrug efflux system outer membrane protein